MKSIFINNANGSIGRAASDWLLQMTVIVGLLPKQSYTPILQRIAVALLL